MNVKTTKAIVCSNIHDSGNPYYIENTSLIRNANQLNGFYKTKGPTTWNFPTDFKNEYWHRNKNITKSHKNVVRYNFCGLTMITGILVILQAANIVVCVKLVMKYRKAHDTIN